MVLHSRIGGVTPVVIVRKIVGSSAYEINIVLDTCIHKTNKDKGLCERPRRTPFRKKSNKKGKENFSHPRRNEVMPSYTALPQK